MLSIRGLTVEVAGKRVIADLSVEIKPQTLTALTGPNGSGKSSLASTLLGSSFYQVTAGKIEFEGQDLLSMSPDERARAGLFVAWQQPISIPGVTVFTLCKSAYESLRQAQGKLGIDSVLEFKKTLEKLSEEVGLTKNHVARDINDGFSGGERKRLELLQLKLLRPKLAILDEIDSGLDENGREMVARTVLEMNKQGTAFVIISHYKDLLTKIGVKNIWELKNGKLQIGS